MGELESHKGKEGEKRVPEKKAENPGLGARQNLGAEVADILVTPKVPVGPEQAEKSKFEEYLEKIGDEFRGIGVEFDVNAYRGAYHMFGEKGKKLSPEMLYGRIEPFFRFGRSSPVAKSKLYEERNTVLSILELYMLGKAREADSAISKLLADLDAKILMDGLQTTVGIKFNNAQVVEFLSLLKANKITLAEANKYVVEIKKLSPENFKELKKYKDLLADNLVVVMLSLKAGGASAREFAKGQMEISVRYTREFVANRNEIVKNQTAKKRFERKIDEYKKAHGSAGLSDELAKDEAGLAEALHNISYFEMKRALSVCKSEVAYACLKKSKSETEEVFSAKDSGEIEKLCAKYAVQLPASLGVLKNAEAEFSAKSLDEYIARETGNYSAVIDAYDKFYKTGKVEGAQKEAILSRLAFESDKLVDLSNGLTERIDKEAVYFEDLLQRHEDISKVPAKDRRKVAIRLQGYLQLLNQHISIQGKLLSIAATYDTLGARPQKIAGDTETRSWEKVVTETREEADSSKNESETVARFLQIKEYKSLDLNMASLSPLLLSLLKKESAEMDKKYGGIMDGVTKHFENLGGVMGEFDKASADPNWAEEHGTKLVRIFKKGAEAYDKIIPEVKATRAKFQEMHRDLFLELSKVKNEDSEMFRLHPQLRDLYLMVLKNALETVDTILTNDNSPISIQQLKRLEFAKKDFNEKEAQYHNGTLKDIAVFGVLMATSIGGGLVGARILAKLINVSSKFLLPAEVLAEGATGARVVSAVSKLLVPAGMAGGGVLGSRVGMELTNLAGLSDFKREDIWDPAQMRKDFYWGYGLSLGTVFAASVAVKGLKAASVSRLGVGAKALKNPLQRAVSPVPGIASYALKGIEGAQKILSPLEIAVANPKAVLSNFGVQFAKETVEETLEEGVDRAHPVLGFLASLINASDGTNLRLNMAGVDAKKVGLSIDGKKIVYNAKTPEKFIADLKSQFEGREGSSFDATVAEDGTVKLSIYGKTLHQSIAEVKVYPRSEAAVKAAERAEVAAERAEMEWTVPENLLLEDEVVQILDEVRSLYEKDVKGFSRFYSLVSGLSPEHLGYVLLFVRSGRPIYENNVPMFEEYVKFLVGRAALDFEEYMDRQIFREIMRHKAGSVNDGSVEDVKPLISAKEVYGDDLEKFRAFLSVAGNYGEVETLRLVKVFYKENPEMFFAIAKILKDYGSFVVVSLVHEGSLCEDDIAVFREFVRVITTSRDAADAVRNIGVLSVAIKLYSSLNNVPVSSKYDHALFEVLRQGAWLFDGSFHSFAESYLVFRKQYEGKQSEETILKSYLKLRVFTNGNVRNDYPRVVGLFPEYDLSNGVTEDNWQFVLFAYSRLDWGEAGSSLEFDNQVRALMDSSKNFILDRLIGLRDRVLAKGWGDLTPQEVTLLTSVYSVSNYKVIESTIGFILYFAPSSSSDSFERRVEGGFNETVRGKSQSLLRKFAQRDRTNHAKNINYTHSDVASFYEKFGLIVRCDTRLLSSTVSTFDALQVDRENYALMHGGVTQGVVSLLSVASGSVKTYLPRVQSLMDDLAVKISETDDVAQQRVILQECNAQITHMLSSFLEEGMGLKDLPPITAEMMERITPFITYLANISNANQEKRLILSFFISLQIFGKWDAFKRGEEIDLSAHLSDENAAKIRDYLSKRAAYDIFVGFDQSFFVKLNESTEAVMVGESGGIVDILGEIDRHAPDLKDPDNFSETERHLFAVVQRFGSKKVGKALSMRFRDASYSDEVIEALGPIDNEKETLPVLQKVARIFGSLLKFQGVVEAADISGHVRRLEDALTPSSQVIAVFQKIDVEMSSGSGAKPISDDIEYLESILNKKRNEITEEEYNTAKGYLDGVRKTTMELYVVKDAIVKEFSLLDEASTKTSELSDRFKSRLSIFRGILVVEAGEKAITLRSTMTGNLDDAIAHIRQCLACKAKEVNNDTNLTFGDRNRFFIVTREFNMSPSQSLSDEIVTVLETEGEDGKKRFSFVMDNVYGVRSPDILVTNVLAVLKKLRSIRRVAGAQSIDIFVTDAALNSCGLTLQHLQEKIQKEFGRVSLRETTRAVTVAPSASGDGHYEIGGGFNGRVSAVTGFDGTVSGVTGNVGGIAISLPTEVRLQAQAPKLSEAKGLDGGPDREPKNEQELSAERSQALGLAEAIEDPEVKETAKEVVGELFGGVAGKSKEVFMKTVEKFRSISAYLKANAKELAGIFDRKFRESGMSLGMSGAQVLQIIYDTAAEFFGGKPGSRKVEARKASAREAEARKAEARRVEQISKLKKLEGLTDGEVEMLVQLFPDGIEVSHFEQGNTGNCYLLSFLHSLKRHPIAPYLFARMIKPVEGGWEVKFPEEQNPIFVPAEKVDGKEEWDPKEGKKVFKKTVQGQLGDKILVVAHAKWRTARALSYVPGRTMALSEGGFSTEPMRLFLGRYAFDIHSLEEGDYRLSFNEKPAARARALEFLKYFSSNPSAYILTASPPVRPTPYAKYTEGEFRQVKYYMDSEYRFVQQHSYSIVAVDDQKRTVTIANPHDTKGKEYTLGYDEFFDYFQDIDVAEFGDGKTRGLDFIYGSYVEGKLGMLLLPDVATKFDAETGLDIKLGRRTVVPCTLRADGSLFLDLKDATGFPGGLVLKPGQERVLGAEEFPTMPGTVSGRHVKVKNLGNGFFTVTDLKSTNGTVVSPNASSEILIKPGEINERLQPNVAVRYNVGEGLTMRLGLTPVPVVSREGGVLFLDMKYAMGIRGGLALRAGEEFVLGKETFDRLPDTVSGRHVKIKNLGNGAFALTDLNSTNGTYVVHNNY
ncbi:MAG: FHA domain-containing protein [Candidatus Gracilibacteria bacterium]|jgi:hypothetical protein